MIFGKFPISTACQKRDGNSDRKEDKNRDRNSDVWSDTRRDRDMGYQEDMKRDWKKDGKRVLQQF